MPKRLVLAAYLTHLLDQQDGVISVAQADAAGFTRRSIQHAVATGRWQRLLPGVLLTHDQPPTRRQRVNAAALWAGESAAIDAESACVWHRIPLPHFDEDAVHVVAPYGSGVRSRDFVVVRRSDVIVVAGRGAVAAYVDAATAAVVSARRLSSDRAAVGLLARPLQTGLVTLDDLVVAHMHAPRRGARLVDRALQQLAVGVRSAGESVAREVFARSKILPPIRWNVWLRLPDSGQLVCADALLEDAGMVIEVNSKRYHAWALTFEDTEARQLRLVASDLVVAPITPGRALADAAGVLRDVEQTYLLHAGRGMPAGVEIVEEPLRRLAA